MNVAPDGRHLLVSGNDTLRGESTSIIDLVTGARVGSIPLEGRSLAVAPDHSYVSDLHRIRAVDTRTFADLGAIELPRNLAAVRAIGSVPLIGDLVVSPNGRYLFVGRTDDGGSNLVTVIDTTSRRVIEDIPVSAKPEELVLSPDGRRLYIAGGATTRGSVMTVDVSPHS